MTRLSKRYIALLCAAVIALSMSGCQNMQGPAAGPAAEGTSDAQTSMEAQVGETDQEAAPFTSPDETENDEGLSTGEGIVGVDAATWVDSDVQQFVKLVDPPRLEDDFHLYVNLDWMLHTELPAGYPSYDPITERSIEVDGQIAALLSNPEKETDPALIHDQELVQKYYQMWMDWDSRNQLGIEPLKERLAPLMEVQTLEELTDYLAKPETAISATELLQCDVSMDWNNADYYAVYVMPVDLIFGDSMYYGLMTEEDALAEPYYDKVIRHILVDLGYSDEEATDILKRCFAFEQDIAEYIMTTEEQSARDAIIKENNPRTLDELEAEAGDFPIREMLAAYGADTSKTYILTEPEWLSAMDVLYDEDYVENLRDYLICYTAQDYATLLDRATYDVYYEVINGISGAQGTKSDEKSASDAVNTFLPMQMGRLYADRYVTDETKSEVTALTNEIIDEYRVMLMEETFLSEETRKSAMNKLDNLQLRIAKPDKWEDDSTLDFKGGDEGGNLLSAQDQVGAYWVERMRSRVNQKVDRDIWTSRIQQVNAFYDPSQNSITICGGILGGSLYDVSMTREELFANVGDTVAHEISHAFDTTGAQFDEKGNLRNWWTEEDQKAFAQRADKLAAYYDKIEPFQDVNCVGSQIEGEAIADLVAMKILLRIAAKEAGFDYDKFFRTFSETWKTITTIQTEYYTLSQDTHPLAYLRVNAVVQQFDEFYDTYGIKKGDGMYLAPDQRLVVW